jgi:3-oxoacyl-[acyl-carrier-protein] synthase-3
MTNADFESIVETSDEWIVTRTGIRERRIADENTHSSDMVVAACTNALAMSGRTPEEIDMLIVGSVTPDFRLPSVACIAQERLGLCNAVAFDIVAACTGFINGLTIARSYIESGHAKCILVCGVEKLSSITNYADRSTCVLFGDAGGAVVVERSENGSGVISSFMRSDGKYARLLCIDTGGTVNPYRPGFADDGTDKIFMNGSEVFKVAVREMGKACVEVISDAGLTADDIALVIPHQANIRIIEAISKRVHVPMDRFFINIEKYGNTSAASVPLALDEANRAGVLKPNDHILMVAFGGGLIWGATLVKW